jgi:phosphoglycerate dehydrogenase-like enzyme
MRQASSLKDGACNELLAISRFGVGFDSVDIAACTENDVAVFIATGAVDRSMAEATVGWMIAITHNMVAKHNLVRTGRWPPLLADFHRLLLANNSVSLQFLRKKTKQDCPPPLPAPLAGSRWEGTQ